MVVLRVACPSHWLMVAKSTPALRRWMAVVCLMVWGWMRLPLSVSAVGMLAVTCLAPGCLESYCEGS